MKNLINMEPEKRKNNAKSACSMLSILAFSVGTLISAAFDDQSLALAIIYGVTLFINTLIIENEV